MGDDETPVGQRFSLVYLERAEPVQDSVRMRKRFATYYYQKCSESYGDKIIKAIHMDLGASVPMTSYSYNMHSYFSESELRDILDTVTVIWRELGGRSNQNAAIYWLAFVKQVFEEENLRYRVDAEGGVHFFVDEEFERSNVATIVALQNPPFNAVSNAFQQSLDYLNPGKQDTKAAVRSSFEAMETMLKLFAGNKKVSRLGPTEVGKILKPKVEEVYSSDPVAAMAAGEMIKGVSDWINAAQLYRHGQKVEEPANPPLELAVAFISQGASYLRWLANIYVLT